MALSYDIRILGAIENTNPILDGARFDLHQAPVESAKELLARIKAEGVTQAEMGRVLGIAQANAATFYTPGKNGKLRTLKWDEGVKLIKALGLEVRDASRSVPSSTTVMRFLAVARRSLPAGLDRQGELEILASALCVGLSRLADQPTIEDDPIALDEVVDAVADAARHPPPSPVQEA